MPDPLQTLMASGQFALLGNDLIEMLLNSPHASIFKEALTDAANYEQTRKQFIKTAIESERAKQLLARAGEVAEEAPEKAAQPEVLKKIVDAVQDDDSQKLTALREEHAKLLGELSQLQSTFSSNIQNVMVNQATQHNNLLNNVKPQLMAKLKVNDKTFNQLAQKVANVRMDIDKAKIENKVVQFKLPAKEGEAVQKELRKHVKQILVINDCIAMLGAVCSIDKDDVQPALMGPVAKMLSVAKDAGEPVMTKMAENKDAARTEICELSEVFTKMQEGIIERIDQCEQSMGNILNKPEQPPSPSLGGG